MQSLKEFSRFVKPYLGIRESYAFMANMRSLGFTDRQLVESAGAGVAEALDQYKTRKILFVCGTGRKGAVGMCAARHMMDYASVGVALVGSASDIKDDVSAFNYSLLAPLIQVYEIGDDDIAKLGKIARSSDIVVDALIGLGMHGRLSKFMVRTIKAVNNSGKRIVSIDVPTGINADTCLPNTASVKAQEVLSIHKRKVPLSKCTAMKVKTVRIGIPYSMELFAGPGDVMLATEPRSMRTNKYDNGAVLVIGGSAEYHGAPLLAAFAALRSGSGYVTLAAPKPAAILLKEASPNLAVRVMPDDIITREEVPAISNIRHDSVVIGPGMSTKKESIEAILEFMRHCDRPIVADAAALRAAAQDMSVLNERTVLTPHEGEFEAMSGINIDHAPVEERIPIAIKFARTHKCTLVLKGHETVITNGKLLKVNVAASPALATMGSGDALSGMLASYLALHGDAFESAVAAVHAHAKIGDVLFLQKGMHITATDVVDAIPNVLKTFDTIKK